MVYICIIDGMRQQDYGCNVFTFNVNYNSRMNNQELSSLINRMCIADEFLIFRKMILLTTHYYYNR